MILGLTALLSGAIASGVMLDRTSSARGAAATSSIVTVGIAFAGKWAYSQKVLPPYADTYPGRGSCPGLSSHPSVHKTDARPVRCWGDNGSGQLGDGTKQRRLGPVSVKLLTASIDAIGAGGAHTCAIVDRRDSCAGVSMSTAN